MGTTRFVDELRQVALQMAALGEEAQAQVGELAKQAKGMMGEQKDLLAEQLGGVSDALQKVAAELEDNGQVSAQYVRMVADGAERLTTSLRDNNVDDIFDLVQDFGRKQPVTRAPLLGEHTEVVLGELLGMGRGEIDELYARGVLG